MMAPSTREMVPSQPRTRRMAVMAIMKGVSTRMVDFATAMGTMTDAAPRMIRIFRMLEPTMLPMVMSALPFRAALMDTAASGALVPMATMVRPMTSWGMRSLAAMPDAPSTNQSAPFTSRPKPRASRSSCRKMFIRVTSKNKISRCNKKSESSAATNCNKVSLLICSAGLSPY